MAEQTFEEFVEKERERLKSKRDTVRGKQKELEKELQGIDREMDAISAYENAKKGGSSGGGTRRSGVRKEVLAIVNGGQGMSRGEILEAMGAKDDKKAASSISQALGALKKGNSIGYDDANKKYLPAY